MNRITKGLFLGVSLLASTSFAQEKSTHTVLVNQFEQTEFSTAIKMDQLPEAVRKDLFERFGGKRNPPVSQISDPGGPFNATDVVNGRPTRRFIFGGNSPGLYFVVYEHGGHGYHLHLEIYRGKKPALAFHGNFFPPDEELSIGVVKRALKNGKVYEQPIKFDW